MTGLLTFLQSNNVSIAAIQETKLTNKSKQLITPGWTAVRLHRHENKGGSLLMLIRDTFPFVDNTAALLQSADPHLERQGISISMSNRQLTAYPRHLHSATKQLQRWSQRINLAPPRHQKSVAFCWGC